MKVAIIGAGPSGLVSAKYVIDNGLTPVVFEKNPQLGGIWHAKTGFVWDNMHSNLSKFSCMFTDLPHHSAKLFPTAKEMHEYLCAYTKKFLLEQYISFNTSVLNVKRNPDKWEIRYQTADAAETREDFDFVIVATGVFSKGYIPPFVGLDDFQGEKLHASHYKNAKAFRASRVAVVGSAFSALEIASDIAKEANSVINITRTPHWILSRYLPTNPQDPTHKLPVDLLFYKRSTRKQPAEIKFKTTEDNARTNTYMANLCKDQTKFCPALRIDPNSALPSQVAISDDYFDCVSAGKITIKGAIDKFDETGIWLKDKTHVAVNAVVFATGYQCTLSFLDKSIQDILQFQPEDQLQPLLLSKCTFHHHLPNMAFVGVYRGPYFAVMELQARWATLVFSKKLTLNIEAIKEDIRQEALIREQQPRPQFPHADYLGLADSLAKEIGCLPDFASLKNDQEKKENAEIYTKLWSGPLLPTHYRLCGPNSDPTLLSKQLLEVEEVLHPKEKHSQPKNLFWEFPKHTVAGNVAWYGVGEYFDVKNKF